MPTDTIHRRPALQQSSIPALGDEAASETAASGHTGLHRLGHAGKIGVQIH
jgi:hypothetical protein